jgi:histidine triad (HIT) family protein
MEHCVFCKIVAGELPSYKVYEDDEVYAFLTIEPVREGHTLVIPKKHIEYVHHMDHDLYAKAMEVVRTLSLTIEKVFNPERVGVVVHGFDVPHAHIHIIPFQDRHDFVSPLLDKRVYKAPSKEELTETLRKIKE